MQVKFLKSIVEDLINKQSTAIIDLLMGKKHVNEFSIAKKMDLTINQTRNILYKLSDYGLVSFIRKKDKRKGWYIYFWTLNVHQSLSLLEQTLKKKLTYLEEQLKSRKEKRFYVCNTCSIEVSEETSLLNDFTCPECEEIYELADNSEIIKQLEKSVNKIKKEMVLLSVEKEKEQEKIDKKKVKELKRLEKEKKDKREVKRKERAKLKAKLDKVNGVKKKPKAKPKKKVVKKAKKKPKAKKKVAKAKTKKGKK